jgi:hypothetical protein
MFPSFFHPFFLVKCERVIDIFEMTWIKSENWIPEVKRSYDWLFGDLSLPPLTSLQILERWIQLRLMKKFVYTLKFVGYFSHFIGILLHSFHQNIKLFIKSLKFIIKQKRKSNGRFKRVS